MAEIITCPACQRKLQVPESYYGQTVACPECAHRFVADPPAEGVQTTPPAPAPKSAAPPASESARSRRRDDDDDDDEYYDSPPVRRPGMAHRGSAVLTLGIIAIVVPCAGLVCGIIAWSMGNRDLAEIQRGRMDREGEGLTQAGRILGMVGTIMQLLQLTVVCLYFGFIAFVIIAHGH